MRAKAYARGANDYVVVAKYDPVDGRSSTALTFSSRGSPENVNNKLNPEGPGEIRVTNGSGNYPTVKAGVGGGQPNVVKLAPGPNGSDSNNIFVIGGGNNVATTGAADAVR